MKKWYWGNCLGMLITCILLVVGLFVFIPLYTHHGQNVPVPKLKGEAYDKAEKAISDAGLQIEVVDTTYDSKLADNVIVKQHLPAGYVVKKGRTIKVTINSTGAPTLILPDIADNCSRQEACLRLLAMGFKLGPIKEITGEGDWVYQIKVKDKVVKAGTPIRTDQPLTLVVGKGGLWDEEEVEYVSDPYSYSGTYRRPVSRPRTGVRSTSTEATPSEGGGGGESAPSAPASESAAPASEPAANPVIL